VVLHLGDVDRGRKRVVSGNETPLTRHLEHREVGHPEELQLLVALGLAQVYPKPPQYRSGCWWRIGHDQEGIPDGRPQAFLDVTEFAIGEELGHRRSQ